MTQSWIRHWCPCTEAQICSCQYQWVEALHCHVIIIVSARRGQHKLLNNHLDNDLVDSEHALVPKNFRALLK